MLASHYLPLLSFALFFNSCGYLVNNKVIFATVMFVCLNEVKVCSIFYMCHNRACLCLKSFVLPHVQGVCVLYAPVTVMA